MTSYSHLLSDGKTDTHLYLAPHFRRTVDGWVPLRAKLRTGGGVVQAPGGVRPFTFGSRAQKLLTIDTGAGPLRLSANNLSITSRRTDGKRVEYPNVAAQTALSYQVLPYGTDERIVLAGPRAPHSFRFILHDPRHTLGRAIRQPDGGYRFSAVAPDGVQMSLGALTVADSTSGTTAAVHDKTQVTASASPTDAPTASALQSASASPAPTPSAGSGAAAGQPPGSPSRRQSTKTTAAGSSAPATGEPVSANTARLAVRSTAGGYAITESIDKSWLENAAFPVTLDPSVMFEPAETLTIPAGDGWADLDDGYCNVGADPDTYSVPVRHDATLPVGENPGQFNSSDLQASYLRWDSSPVFGPGTVVTQATLHMQRTGGTGSDFQVRLERFPWSWQSQSGNACAILDGYEQNPGEPGYVADPASLFISSGDANAGSFDITSVFQEWVNDPAANNGITLDQFPAVSGAGVIYGSLASNNPEYMDVVTDGNIVPPTPLPTSQVQGDPCSCTTGGNDVQVLDPVNTATGETVEHVADATIGSGQAGLGLTRVYDSGITSDGPFGRGWSMQQFGSVVYDADSGVASVTTGDGSTLQFARQPDGTYLPPVGATATLVDNGNGWTLTNAANVNYTFNTDGTIASVVDPVSGHQLSYAYSNGQLSTVTDQNGNQLTFSYGTNGFVSAVGVKRPRFFAAPMRVAALG